MAEYYRNPYEFKSEKNESRSLWLIVSDAIMWIFTLAILAAMFLIFIGRFISPERMWYFSLLGLVAPMVYIALILSMLYWIIRWKGIAIMLTGIFVIIGLFHVSLYYKIDYTKQYGEKSYDRTALKVLTFNTHNFSADNGSSSLDSVYRLVQTLNPDIICIQEFGLDLISRKTADDKFRSYNFASSKLETPSPTMECMTKHRILNSRRIEDLGGTGICISTDLLINDDTIRVYNTHLQTTSVTSDDKQYISNVQFISDSTREQRFTQIAQALRQNNITRALQAEIIHKDISNSPYPVIVCGDFNDVPISYSYRTMAKGLEDSFRKQGHLYSATFRGFFDVLRIDYILSSPEFETLSYEVLPTGDISDHYPILVRLKQTSKQ